MQNIKHFLHRGKIDHKRPMSKKLLLITILIPTNKGKAIFKLMNRVDISLLIVVKWKESDKITK